MVKKVVKQILKIGGMANYIHRNPGFIKLLLLIYNRTLGLNRFRVGNNRLIIGSSMLNKSRVTIIGSNNTVEICDFSYLFKTNITVLGSNNTIRISNEVIMNHVHLDIENDLNTITIGKKSTFHGRTDLAAIEGTLLEIGDDCMFSGNILVRTGDSHSIIDKHGKRINHSKDILIGAHVWIGVNVTCLKGTKVSDNCIVGAGSLLNRVYDESYSIIAGNPGKVIKTEVNWLRERI